MADAVTLDQYSAGGAAEQLNAALGAMKGVGGGSFAASQIGITAGTTRTQAGAYALSTPYSRVDTSTAQSATTGLGDGVALPLSTAMAGSFFVVHNNTANSIQVYGTGSDTVNEQTGSIGITQPRNSVHVFYCTAANKWFLGSTKKTTAFKTNTATGDATLAAANISGGAANVDLALTGTLSGGANATLPLVTDVVATTPNLTVGNAYRLRICNQSAGAFTWTVVTNTGWTVTGTMTIAQNTWREFVVTFTSLTAATLQNVAVGTFS